MNILLYLYALANPKNFSTGNHVIIGLRARSQYLLTFFRKLLNLLNQRIFSAKKGIFLKKHDFSEKFFKNSYKVCAIIYSNKKAIKLSLKKITFFHLKETHKLN